MMGGSTKIGIGRTTRVNAVSMIAWGRRWEHCAHASFQILQRLRFNFLFHEIRTCAEWRPGVKQEIMNLQPPSRLQISENIQCNVFNAVERQKGNSHASPQFWTIPPPSRCCPERRRLRTARCVSSGPRYRCLHWLERERQLLLIGYNSTGQEETLKTRVTVTENI